MLSAAGLVLVLVLVLDHHSVLEGHMRRYTRGEFLSLSAMLAGAAGLAKLPFRRLSAQPTRHNRNEARGSKPISSSSTRESSRWTRRSRGPKRFAVKDGRFLAIGSTADVRNVATQRTTVIDAAGMCVVPGFIDAHCHPSGVNELFGVVVTPLKTKAELIEALRKKAATTPPGFWVSGRAVRRHEAHGRDSARPA